MEKINATSTFLKDVSSLSPPFSEMVELETRCSARADSAKVEIGPSANAAIKS